MNKSFDQDSQGIQVTEFEQGNSTPSRGVMADSVASTFIVLKADGDVMLKPRDTLDKNGEPGSPQSAASKIKELQHIAMAGATLNQMGNLQIVLEDDSFSRNSHLTAGNSVHNRTNPSLSHDSNNSVKMKKPQNYYQDFLNNNRKSNPNNGAITIQNGEQPWLPHQPKKASTRDVTKTNNSSILKPKVVERRQTNDLEGKTFDQGHKLEDLLQRENFNMTEIRKKKSRYKEPEDAGAPQTKEIRKMKKKLRQIINAQNKKILNHDLLSIEGSHSGGSLTREDRNGSFS